MGTGGWAGIVCVLGPVTWASGCGALSRSSAIVRSTDAFAESKSRLAVALRAAAERDDATAALEALGRHRLLCAHREGPYGVGGWNRLVERLVAERTGVVHYDEWYAGRPILVTAEAE